MFPTRVSTDIPHLNPVKDKAQHAVLLDKTTSDKLYKDVQSYRLVTVATLVDRLKVNGSLARKCLKDLEEKGQIKAVVTHSKMKIYSTFFSHHSRTIETALLTARHSPRCWRHRINYQSHSRCYDDCEVGSDDVFDRSDGSHREKTDLMVFGSAFDLRRSIGNWYMVQWSLLQLHSVEAE